MKAPLLLVTLSVALASPSAFAAKDSAKPASAAAGYTVKPGDSFAKIARALGTTAENLAKANDLGTDAIIRPGQTLKIPAKSAAPAKSPAPAKSQTAAAKGSDNTHQVQAGETFTSIAKKHGISSAALAAANPAAVPTALQLGQVLNLVGSPKPAKAEPDPVAKAPQPAKAAVPEEKAPAPTAAKAIATAEAPPAPKIKTPAAEEIAPPPAAKVPPAPRMTPAIAEVSPPPAEAPAAAGPKYITATVDSETTLGDFAAKHGADAKRLNELNGLDLTTETVLAKGSELIVPSQP